MSREAVKKKGGTELVDASRPSTLLSWTPIIALNVFMIFFGVFIATFLPNKNDWPLKTRSLAPENTAVQLLGLKGALLFKSLDTNEDGNISQAEFGPIVEKLTGETPPVLAYQRSDGNSGSAILLLTDFIPLVFESMKTFEDDGADGMMRHYQAMTGLRSWSHPAMSEASFHSREFSNFLPKAGDETLGKAYWIYKPDTEPWYHGNSAKYYPPKPSFGGEILYKLMRMFHSRPFLLTRFGPYGSAAVVQAYNDHFYNIKFRIHCEFQVNEPPKLPFWVTPAQFTGNLVVSKDGLEVRHFSLQLPADRLLNVDMEWITQLANEETGDGERMEVEIGYQPKMSLLMSDAEEVNSFNWTANISDFDASSALEKAFYPFKEVTYHPIENSFQRAEAEGKLVHSIVLWGSLDDQSC